MFRYEIVNECCNTKGVIRHRSNTKLSNIDLLKKDIYLPLNNLNLDTATKLALQNSQVSNELKTIQGRLCYNRQNIN